MSLGFLEDKADPGEIVREKNRYVLALLPYEETTTYGKGVGRAPEAVVEASSHVELFDEVLKVDASRSGILTVRPPITDLASITRAGPYITDQSYQFCADVVGVAHSGRGYCRTRTIFDLSGGTPRIIHHQDLSAYGWPLGASVRQLLRDAKENRT